jgi:aryl-alcohol dehydrogenase-like predicted oxidoreductase
MEYTQLGETGLEISRLCLGCMNFGSGEPWMLNDEAASHDLLAAAMDAGVNFLDTANVYSRGESERIVGDSVAERDRSELVVATKVFGQMGDGPNQSGLSRKHVIDQCHASLNRLGLDYIDLYQIHRFDDDTPLAETLSALDYLVDEGLVRYVGASTMPAWKFTKALYQADADNHQRFVSMQPEYNAVDRHEEVNVLPVCDSEGIGVLPWSPLAGGFLAGKYERGEAPESGRAATDEYTAARFTEENWQVLETIREVAAAKSTTTAQVALAWLLSQEVVDAPIIGPRTQPHLEDNLGALELSLSSDQRERIEAPVTPRWPAAAKDT